MEYNAGRLLYTKLDFKISNSQPHLLEPSYFCKQYLQVMNNCNISKSEIHTKNRHKCISGLLKKEKVKF